MVYDIAVLGGGASGLVAAINLAAGGFKVAILECKPRVGQKILLTGNGRCNLTNLDISVDNYQSRNLELVRRVISEFGCAEVLDFFSSIGLLTRSKDSLVYPLSNKASSVLDCLRNAALKYDVDTIVDFELSSLEQSGTEYRVKSAGGMSVSARKVIFATGINAYDGPDISLKIMKKLGHNIEKPYPALVQLRSDDAFLRGLKGVKFIGEIRAVKGGKVLRAERGEVLFTDYGVSGIAVMQLSYLFSQHADIYLELDFMPEMDFGDVEKLLDRIKSLYGDTKIIPEEYLVGLLEKKLITRILKHTETPDSKSLAKSLKAFSLKISGHNGFKNAQVCGGGVNLDDFDANTLESRHSKGVYAIGEILDVVGDCGGYNLHWAWASALYVSSAIGVLNVAKEQNIT